MKSRLQELRDEGFDKSYYIPFTKYHKVRCSECEALVINSVPCHESGCINQVRAAVASAIKKDRSLDG